MYEIETGIPIARKAYGRKYPFDKLKIDQSFFALNGEIHKVSSAASAYGRRTGTRFTCRAVPSATKPGVRVWRVV